MGLSKGPAPMKLATDLEKYSTRKSSPAPLSSRRGAIGNRRDLPPDLTPDAGCLRDHPHALP